MGRTSGGALVHNCGLAILSPSVHTATNIKEQLRALFNELYQEAQEQDYTDRSMQAGFV